jgi:hypothetical protein
MQGLATVTVIMYVLAFVITFGVIAAWLYAKARKKSVSGESLPRHVDDSSDRVA